KRLADNTPPKVIAYSSSSANQVFEFIDIEFYSKINEISKKNFCFCSKEKWTIIIDMVEKHMLLYSLIPNLDRNFLLAQEIWRQSTYEIYKFCVDNDLQYKKFAYFEQQYFVNHYLPKFFRPRLDLVIYIIITHMIPHNQHQYDRYFNGCEKPSWRKDFKQE
ncbi:18884_t:CDS:2, partial [Dentiscutata erythropus]